LMFDLVTNLLDLNRIEQGQTALELKACNLWEIVHNSALDYANRGNAKQIKLHFEGSERTPEVLADSGSLGQVVDNLISNAVKYSPRGKWIWVRVYQNGSLVRTEVQDEGPGISKEDLKKLFGKFVRLSAKPTGGESSTGLGLAIVKRLVESMGGTVWCES